MKTICSVELSEGSNFTTMVFSVRLGLAYAKLKNSLLFWQPKIFIPRLVLSKSHNVISLQFEYNESLEQFRSKEIDYEKARRSREQFMNSIGQMGWKLNERMYEIDEQRDMS